MIAFMFSLFVFQRTTGWDCTDTIRTSPCLHLPVDIRIQHDPRNQTHKQGVCPSDRMSFEMFQRGDKKGEKLGKRGD